MVDLELWQAEDPAFADQARVEDTIPGVYIGLTSLGTSYCLPIIEADVINLFLSLTDENLQACWAAA